MENKRSLVSLILLAAILVGCAHADECPKTVQETGWVPLNKRQLHDDVVVTSETDRLSDLQKTLGAPAYRQMVGDQPKAIWAYGAKKKVTTNDCGKVDVKYFLEAHLISVNLEGDRIVSCTVLRRTIASTSKTISPIQERDVLPFTIEESTCKEWLTLNPPN